MRKISAVSIVIFLMVSAIIFISSCKKDKEESKGCVIRKGSEGGLLQEPTGDVIFYALKDLGCTDIALTKLRNIEDGSTGYRGGGKIDRYFNQPPLCGNKTGTINITIYRGYTYEYTLTCSNKTYTGTFKLNCDEECRSIEVK